jgi:hypothetical protein
MSAAEAPPGVIGVAGRKKFGREQVGKRTDKISYHRTRICFLINRNYGSHHWTGLSFVSPRWIKALFEGHAM